MNNKFSYMYISSMCAMFIVVPGRFVCALVLLLDLLFVMITGTLFSYFLKFIKMEKLKSVLLLFFLVFAVLFFRQILILTMPVLALSLGFILFLPAISTYTFSFLFGSKNENLLSDLRLNSFHILKTSIYGILISLIRDILGYGTFTFLGVNGIIEKVIFPAEHISLCSFIASVPGALILCSLILIFYILVLKKIDILRKSGEQI